MNGEVYRLVPKAFYESHFLEYGIPEMLRSPLEKVVLKSKLLEIGSPPEILSLSMTPPRINNILSTILLLKEVGALHKTVDDIYTRDDGDISFMGRVMAALPVDVHLSRLIILGYVFGSLEEAIIIAAGLSVRSLFRIYGNNWETECSAFTQKLIWAKGSGSDVFAILNVYKSWRRFRVHQSKLHEEEDWAKRHFVNIRGLREMSLLIAEITDRLSKFKLDEYATTQRVCWTNYERTIILKIIVAGAFYPNYFLYNNQNNLEWERDVYQTLTGYDPCNTVYMNGFSMRHIRPLYMNSIKEIFCSAGIRPENIRVRFNKISERVYITFKDKLNCEYLKDPNELIVPGQVRPELYKATNLRHHRKHISINVMEPSNEISYVENNNIGQMYEGIWQPIKSIVDPSKSVLPSLFSKTISGFIVHIKSCNEFNFQPECEHKYVQDFSKKLETVKEHLLPPKKLANEIMLVALWDGMYRRAKVLNELKPYNQCRVLFVDYGNVANIDSSDLRQLPTECQILKDLPPRQFECRLALVQPSSVHRSNGKWGKEVLEEMKKLLNTNLIEIEIYSLVENTASVAIKLPDGKTFNEMLVEMNLAQKCDESYVSKSDHEYRLRKQTQMSRLNLAEQMKENMEYLISLQTEDDVDIPAPPANECQKKITLRGPFSPLELNIKSIINTSLGKMVAIEKESVNCVLFNTDPYSGHNRLVVSAQITDTELGNKLVARHTTLMPNIHGLGALLLMLFAPTVQMKPNKNRTKYITLLAGLGYDPETYESLFPEHDVVLNLDAAFTEEDLNTINEMRYCMDCLLHTDPGIDVPYFNNTERSDLATHLRELMTKILNANRKYIEFNNIVYDDNLWVPYNNTVFVGPIFGNRSYFPPHQIIMLRRENDEYIKFMQQHCEELHSLGLIEAKFTPQFCKLCNISLESVTNLRIHLISQLHLGREKEIDLKRGKM